MVHPAWRRLGVFSRLWDAATAEIADRGGCPEALLVVDRVYGAGAAFALSVGGALEHSEHRMVLRREPAAFVRDPRVSVRRAGRDDATFVIACLAEAFDFPTGVLEAEEVDSLARRFPGTFVVERAGEAVGTVRVERKGEVAGIYGFAVLPRHQGQGIGRQVLSGLARELLAEGMREVGLEVSVSNDSALHLYESCGFEVTGTEDYYKVAVRLPRRSPSLAVMRYRTLGSTGIEVSTYCLGAMMFGKVGQSRPRRRRAHRARRPRCRHQLHRHRGRLLSRRVRGDRRQGPEGPARRCRARHEGPRQHGRGPQPLRQLAPVDRATRSSRACGASAPSGSTCTRSTGPIPGPTSRRPCRL